MKKIALFITILVFSTSQLKASGPIRWWIIGGMNISKPTHTSYSEGYGFHLGGKIEYKLFNNESGFYISPAVLLSLKGGKPVPVSYPGDKDVRTNEHNYYLDIPVYFGYKHSFNRKVALFGGVGPYMGVGLFGKYKRKADGVANSVNPFGNNGYLNRFDAGMGSQIGLEFVKRIQFTIGYELGLKNISKKYQYKNRNFMVSCGYMF